VRDYIERHEIAKLMGVNATRLVTLLSTKDFNMPDPVSKDRNILLYDRKAFMTWLGHWLAEEARKQPVDTCENVITYHDIMIGTFDSPSLKRSYKFKKLASKSRQPKSITQRVHWIQGN